MGVRKSQTTRAGVEKQSRLCAQVTKSVGRKRKRRVGMWLGQGQATKPCSQSKSASRSGHGTLWTCMA